MTLSIDGHTPIDVLMVHPEQAESLAELERGDDRDQGRAAAGGGGDARSRRPTSPRASSTRRCSSTASTRSPTGSCLASPAIPGWRSNEPGALERAGLAFDLYDPADYDIPGSFGVIYTSPTFLAEHPSAVEDFMRATMRGLADAIADPAGRRRGGRADQRPRQPELPVAGGRDVPLGDRRRRRSSPPHRRAATSECRSAAELERADQRLRRGRLLGRQPSRRRSKAATTPTSSKNLYDDNGTVIWPG